MVGRVTIDFPIQQIPADCMSHMSTMMTEAATMYVAFLNYMEKQAEKENLGFSFKDYFEDSSFGLKIGYFLDHDNQTNACSLILAHFCKFIALGYWGYMDLTWQDCKLCNEPICLGCPYDQSYVSDDPEPDAPEPDDYINDDFLF